MATTFTFDADEFKAVVAEWEKLLAELKEQRAVFKDLQGLAAQPPAEDEATQAFLQQARTALQSAHGSGEALLDYVERFLGNLRMASTKYVATDTNGANVISVVVE